MSRDLVSRAVIGVLAYRALPGNGRWAMTRDVFDDLHRCDRRLSLRTVQRLLNALRDAKLVERQGKPRGFYRWRLAR